MQIRRIAGPSKKSTTLLASATALLTAGVAIATVSSFVGIWTGPLSGGGMLCPGIDDPNAQGASALAISEQGQSVYSEAISTGAGGLVVSTTCNVSGNSLVDCNTSAFNSMGQIGVTVPTVLTATLSEGANSFTVNGSDTVTAAVDETCTVDYTRPSGVVLDNEGGSTEADDSGDPAAQVNRSSQIATTNTVNTASQQVKSALAKFKGGSDGQSATGVIPVAGGMRYQGVAAGDGFSYPFGVWVTYEYSEFKDRFAATAFDADRNSVLGGIDFTPYDNAVFGVAFGYEDSDIDTQFNAGGTKIDGFSVVPYMGLFLSDYVDASFDLSMDLSLGFSRLDIDSDRTNGVGTKVTGSTNSNRYFLGTNLNVGQQFGNLYVSGLGGIIVARDDIEGFTESDGTVITDSLSTFGQFRFGGELAYGWNGFEPFVNTIYRYDYNREQLPGGHPNDDDDFRVGLGLRYLGESGWSGGVEFNTVLDRDKFDDDSVSISIRGDF